MPSSFVSRSERTNDARSSGAYTPYSPDPSYPYPMTPHSVVSSESSFFPADRPQSSWQRYTRSLRFSMLTDAPPNRVSAPTPTRAAAPHITLNTKLTSPTWEPSKFSPYTEIDLEEPRTPPSTAPPHNSWPRARAPSVFRPASHVSKEGRLSRMSRLIFGPPSPTTPSTGDLEQAPLAAEPKMDPQPALSPWPALNVAKNPAVPNPTTARLQQAFPTPRVPGRAATYDPSAAAEAEMARRRRETERKRRGWCVLIVFILLVVILLAILLPLTLIRADTSPAPPPSPSPSPATPSPSADPATTPGLSADAAECLSSFRLSAPAAPGSYPCSTCFTSLRAIPASVLDNSTDAQAIGDAIQFCALKAIFDSAGGQGGALGQAGWLANLDTCTYPGISCMGSSGRVSSIELAFPGVPAVLPAELVALTTLRSLKITGNGAIPAGPFPKANSLPPAIMQLELVNTALVGPLDNALFANRGPLSDATTISLVNNPQLGTTLPDGLKDVPLTNLVVNGQNLDMTLDSIFTSAVLSRTLQTLSLASNALSSPLAGPISLNALTTLDLSSNDISAILPSATFPAGLTTLNLSDNPMLGSLPQALCASTVLKSCDFRQTLFPGTTQCGACQFA